MAIDWSGARSPEKSRAVALAWCDGGDAAPTVIDYPLTRACVREWIAGRVGLSERCLIGIDCNFGYAEETGRAQFGEAYTYLDLWRAVEESSSSLPDYFAQGFWQHEIYGRPFWTSGPRPSHFDAARQRLTERVCREGGYGNPESPFKLIGPKQVGKGGLAGMRVLHSLKHQFGNQICIWPFENHTDQANVVIAEIYPRLFLKTAGFGQAKIRNSTALNHALSFFKSKIVREDMKFSDHMTDAIISSAGLRYLAGSEEEIPDKIARPHQMTGRVAMSEGWILGV